MDPPVYDTTELAQSLLDYETIEWKRRETELVTEYKALVGSLCIHHEYSWNTKKTLAVRLHKELDCTKTSICPWDNQIPPDMEWESGYSTENHAPTTETKKVKDKIESSLLQANILQYSSIDEIFQQMEAGFWTESDCDDCKCAPCLRTENKQSVVHDNYRLVSDATNKQRRFFAYRLMCYAIWGRLGKGQRRELPKCVVEGVRSEWPEDNKRKYTGFKDT